MSITISRIKVSPQEIRQGLLQLDDAIFSVEMVDLFQRVMPSKEEVEKVRAYFGNSTDEDLAKKEKRSVQRRCSFWNLLQSHGYKQRYVAWISS